MWLKIKVRPRDTLWYYGQIFQIPLPLLEDSNPGVIATQLDIESEINIPGYRLEEYQVQAGDTLWEIAVRRNLTLEALLLSNPGINPYQLPIGQKIWIPVRVRSPIVMGERDYDYQALETDLQGLQELYPFMRVETIGHSVLGKPLYEIQLGRGSRVIHFNGSFHANEWITTAILMQLLNTYLLSLVNNTPVRGILPLPLYENNLLSIVPMVNPDGVDLVINGPPEERRDEVMAINQGNPDFSLWKANIRGVDLNNQYPANWEIEKKRKEPKMPAPRDYPGDFPLTEPEAIAMANLARNRDFTRVFAFHTQGREFYWGYEGFEPPESEALARAFAGTSGYEPVQYIDSHAGYKDWFIYEFKRPGFTFELGYGTNPLPIRQFQQIYEEMLGVFFLALDL